MQYQGAGPLDQASRNGEELDANGPSDPEAVDRSGLADGEPSSG